MLTKDIGMWHEKLSLSSGAKVSIICHSRGAWFEDEGVGRRGIENPMSSIWLVNWVMKLLLILRDGRLSRCGHVGYLPASSLSCTLEQVGERVRLHAAHDRNSQDFSVDTSHVEGELPHPAWVVQIKN